MRSNKIPIDALLIHSYWYDLNNLNNIDICNRIQILATIKLLKKYQIKSIVITGGSLLKGRSPIGEEIKKELRARLHKSSQTPILVFPYQKTTLGEIREFKKKAGKYKWLHLASIGLSIHMQRIKKGFKRVFNKQIGVAYYFSSDKIIKDNKRLYTQYLNSRELRILTLNEFIANKISNIPFFGNIISILLEYFAKALSNKGYIQPRILNIFIK